MLYVEGCSGRTRQRQSEIGESSLKSITAPLTLREAMREPAECVIAIDAGVGAFIGTHHDHIFLMSVATSTRGFATQTAWY